MYPSATLLVWGTYFSLPYYSGRFYFNYLAQLFSFCPSFVRSFVRSFLRRSLYHKPFRAAISVPTMSNAQRPAPLAPLPLCKVPREDFFFFFLRSACPQGWPRNSRAYIVLHFYHIMISSFALMCIILVRTFPATQRPGSSGSPPQRLQAT